MPIQNSKYTSVEQFVADVRLVFDNCREYNDTDDYLLIRLAGERLKHISSRLVDHWIVQKPIVEQHPRLSIVPSLGTLDDDYCMVRGAFVTSDFPASLHR